MAVTIVPVAGCTEHCSMALRDDTIIKTTIRIGINWYMFPAASHGVPHLELIPSRADKEDKAVAAAKDIPAGVR